MQGDKEFSSQRNKINSLETKCNTLNSNYNHHMKEVRQLESIINDLEQKYTVASTKDKKSKTEF